MSAVDGGTRAEDGTSVVLVPAPLGLTMLGATDAGACADGLCAVPGADSST